MISFSQSIYEFAIASGIATYRWWRQLSLADVKKPVERRLLQLLLLQLLPLVLRDDRHAAPHHLRPAGAVDEFIWGHQAAYLGMQTRAIDPEAQHVVMACDPVQLPKLAYEPNLCHCN